MKKIIGTILLVLSIIIIVMPIIIKNNKKIPEKVSLETELNNLMQQYCKSAYIDITEEDGTLYLSLKDMKEIFEYDITKFEEKCSLENSMVKAYIKDGKLVCENDLKCDFNNTEYIDN